MQAFKLVNAGFVDKVIVFDSLPERLYKNVKTRPADGFPRSWGKWLAEIGSTRTVNKTETSVDLARNWTYKHTPIGKEPCFFVLEYTDLNSDKESWRAISEYVRQHVAPEVRLREKIEDMALALAPNSKESLSVEYEDIPVIQVPSEVTAVEEEIIQHGEVVLVQEPVKRKGGRPRKVAVAVEA